MLVTWCFNLFILSNSLEISDSLLLVSSSTPPGLLLMFKSENILNLDSIVDDERLSEISFEKCLFMIDLSYSRSYQSKINQISLYFDISYLSFFSYDSNFKYRAEVHANQNSEFKSIETLLSHLNINEYTVLASSSSTDTKLAERFLKKNGCQVFFYSDQLSKAAADSIVLKVLKTQGVITLVLIDSSESLPIIEKSFKKRL